MADKQNLTRRSKFVELQFRPAGDNPQPYKKMPLHITGRYIKAPGIEGEFTVDDYGIFLGRGALQHVSRYWEATVAQSLILDKAHAEALNAVSEDQVQTENDPECAAMAQERREILRLSNDLVKANIFCLLTAFFEFAILEVYSLVFSGPPAPTRPRFQEDILKPLQARKIVGEVPDTFQKHVLDNRDAVRNAFTHGRWRHLQEATNKVDLYDVFLAIISYFGEVEHQLRGHAFDP